MRIIALLGIRNEELYLERCLSHLKENGIEICVIDNDSTDRSMDIVRSFEPQCVVRIERMPFDGFYDWVGILKKKMELASSMDADWFIHHDGDEIREAPWPGRTLKQGIEEVDRMGYNAIDFDEFVFLPCIEDDHGYEGLDYVREMRYYYHFLPKPLHRVNAWKNTGTAVDLVPFGGHRAEFEGRRIFPENFILRHYIGLSKEQLIQKYTGRTYSREEVEKRRWHGKRAFFKAEDLILPSRSELKKVSADGLWDTSDTWAKHKFFGE